MFERITRSSVLFALLALPFFPVANAVSQERAYPAMQGVSSPAHTVFDFRVGDPKVAVGHLDLIHGMRTDAAMRVQGTPPELVVVFIGPSVKLISTDAKAAAGSSKAVADKLSAMRKDGVRFEVCMTTAHALDVPADSILPGITKVGNGWVSLAGWQQRGYAMIADF